MTRPDVLFTQVEGHAEDWPELPIPIYEIHMTHSEGLCQVQKNVRFRNVWVKPPMHSATPSNPSFARAELDLPTIHIPRQKTTRMRTLYTSKSTPCLSLFVTPAPHSPTAP